MATDAANVGRSRSGPGSQVTPWAKQRRRRVWVHRLRRWSITWVRFFAALRMTFCSKPALRMTSYSKPALRMTRWGATGVKHSLATMKAVFEAPARHDLTVGVLQVVKLGVGCAAVQEDPLWRVESRESRVERHGWGLGAESRGGGRGAGVVAGARV